MVERFQQYSRLEAKKHLKSYTQNDKFWKHMSNALLHYDYTLRPDTVKLIMCDDYFEGTFLPDDSQILLCANTLMRQQDFKNAMARQLILLYDHTRGQFKYQTNSESARENATGIYDLNKCKHLACSEVRAAMFTDRCKVGRSVTDAVQKDRS